jgi:serine/threonine-protein kinase HipA
MARRIYVYADWQSLPETQQVGMLTTDLVRGKEIFSFEYAPSWLDSGFAQMLDPDLQLYAGPQYLNGEKPNFGMFLDSCPDRWGRVLMRRREAILSRKEERAVVTLQESDYLLGVFDGTRMGGLRFKIAEDGEFLSHATELAAPPWVTLRDLEYASLQLEKDEIPTGEELKWLNMLMAPGSSLGGARPKASVADPDGNLWIAKFPSTKDDHNIGAWEMVVHDLAVQVGIQMAPAPLQHFSGRHHTFLTRRFDRINGNERLHFASAMTLLGQQDGADFHNGVSYLDLVGFIIRSGRKVNDNLRELWTRMLFNILVKNTDDHLRNHGFLLYEDGWELSPAFDINPNHSGNGLTLNISQEDNSLDTGLALSVAKHFRLKAEEAQSILDHLLKVVSGWEDVAAKYGLTRRERETMAAAFHKG